MSHKSTVDRCDKGDSLLEVLDSYVAIDLETTGKVPFTDEIIEFCAVRVEDGEVVERFSSLANPGRPIPLDVSALTGITNEMAAQARPVADVLFDFLHFIRDDVLVGHNVSFDINFIYDSAKRHYHHGIDNCMVDTLRIARRALPDLPNHRLPTVLAHFGLTNDSAHRAEGDAYAAHQLYERLKPYIFNGDVKPESAVFGGYTYDAIFDSVQRMIGYDEDNVSLKVLKSGASVYMFGSVAFSIKLNSRTQCMICQLPAALEYVGASPAIQPASGGVSVSIETRDEDREPIAQLVRAVYEDRHDAAGGSGNIFGCCSDFIRCSDMMVCLRKGNPDYNGCLYRKNLEAGRIFYGKNRNYWPDGENH